MHAHRHWPVPSQSSDSRICTSPISRLPSYSKAFYTGMHLHRTSMHGIYSDREGLFHPLPSYTKRLKDMMQHSPDSGSDYISSAHRNRRAYEILSNIPSAMQRGSSCSGHWLHRAVNLPYHRPSSGRETPSP